VRPIQASIDAANELNRTVGGDLLADVRRMAERVREVAPGCIGLSLATSASGVTLTMVATDEEIATLDALQYLDGGPCLEAAKAGHGVEAEVSQAFDEEGWQLYAQGAAAAGVASSLTVPVLRAGRVMGTVNLYGAATDTFTGLEQQIAAVVGGWAGGAVANADLSFSTRELAERAPTILKELSAIDAATGVLSVSQRLTIEEARAKLRKAALRAGPGEAQLARAILDLHGRGRRDR
jgi:GAF domain-containing protein